MASVGFSGVHVLHRINALAGFRLALSTCVYRRGSLAGSLGVENTQSEWNRRNTVTINPMGRVLTQWKGQP